MKLRIDEINKSKLDDIEFLDDFNNPIKIDKKIIDDFKFTGLNNVDFICSEFYKFGFKDKE